MLTQKVNRHNKYVVKIQNATVTYNMYITQHPNQRCNIKKNRVKICVSCKLSCIDVII